MKNEDQINCGMCKFWNKVSDAGECRHKPPVGGMWPVTNPDDWCGKARVDKLTSELLLLAAQMKQKRELLEESKQ